MRARIFSALEQAEQAQDGDVRRQWLRFVVVGAGPTGVEVAGALGELTQCALRRNFTFDPREAEIYLIEGSDRILSPYALQYSAHVELLCGDDVGPRQPGQPQAALISLCLPARLSRAGRFQLAIATN